MGRSEQTDKSRDQSKGFYQAASTTGSVHRCNYLDLTWTVTLIPNTLQSDLPPPLEHSRGLRGGIFWVLTQIEDPCWVSPGKHILPKQIFRFALHPRECLAQGKQRAILINTCKQNIFATSLHASLSCDTRPKEMPCLFSDILWKLQKHQTDFFWFSKLWQDVVTRGNN